jgi:hypothetical protein
MSPYIAVSDIINYSRGLQAFARDWYSPATGIRPRLVFAQRRGMGRIPANPYKPQNQIVSDMILSVL